MNAVPGSGRLSTSGSRRSRGRRSLAAIALAVGVAGIVQVAPAAADTPVFGAGNAPSFGLATNFDSGVASTRAVAVGDLNNDGKPDLATVAQNGGLSVLLGTGGGGFGAPTNYPVTPNPFSSSTFIVTVAIADLNHDGNRDIVSEDASGNVALVWLGTGTGTFSPVSKIELNPHPNCGTSSTNPCLAGFPTDAQVADLNGDGVPDLITTNGTTSNVAVELGNGDGSFAPPTYFGLNGGQLPEDMAIGDVNNDGHLDLVLANVTTNNISVLLGDGHGSFGTATNVDPGYILPEFVRLGDFNEDGNVDIVSSNTGFDGAGSILPGDGAGGFGAPLALSTGDNPSSLNVADINGDGHLDLVVGTSRSNSVQVWAGDGGGSFAPPVSLGLNGATRPSLSAVADVDGDGRPDIVTSNLSTSAAYVKDVSVLLNTTPPPSPATAQLGAHVPGYLSLTGGSADFGSVVPTAGLATYFATAQLAVRTTYPGITVNVGTATANVDLGGLGELQVVPWQEDGTWNLFQNVPRPVFGSTPAANQVVPISYRLQVQGDTVLTRGHTYSEPIVYTATSPLP
ncbi:MAG TPA: VCBS repeat-containing protein [Solirubrobacteraceae bacterium]|nr:VCBS repeat-containing protein [Solirubrobacteraceae bacterium]